MEARLVPKAGYAFESVKAAGFKRKLTPGNIAKNVKALSYLAASSGKARRIIEDFGPDVAVGTGGYVSGPVIRMAAKMGVPTAIHEANAFPGLTTKLLSREVDLVMLSTEAAAKYLEGARYAVTGMPVRGGMAKRTREEGRRALGFDGCFCLLSFGGSLGSRRINEVIFEFIKRYESDTGEGAPPINHIHGYGGIGRDFFPAAMEKAALPLITKRRRVTEYINDMDICLAAADLVICRAGASAIEELQARGRASILVPSPNVTENHQLHNAMVMGRAGAAIVIEERHFNADVLIKTVGEFRERREGLDALAERAAALYVGDANERIYNAVSGLLTN
jgi:UDP-N-acetylglucosamine--N-acetylmuramyl-(pentapeptide) pyrophosphoryl-undecaprenol N-acetylglucosamine transferase